MILLIMGISAYSQSNPCQPECQYGPVQLFTYKVCSALDMNGDPQMAAFVMIYYRTMTCNGVTSLQMENLVFIDDRQYWIDELPPLYGNYPTYDPDFICTINRPATEAEIIQALKDALQAAMVSLNLQTDIRVYFKGSCQSMVDLDFPEGFVVQYNDSTGHDTIPVSSLGRIAQFVPCNTVCCNILYQMRIHTAEDGYTFIEYVPGPVESPTQTCEDMPLPVYRNVAEKFRMYIMNPVTGQWEEKEGTPVGQESCKLFCDAMSAPGPFNAFFTTDVVEPGTGEHPLTLSASPTLFDSYIRFTGSLPISQVVMYDMSGREVLRKADLSDHTLNTDGIPKGIYFVQVYFTDNMVKTIKVMKP